MNLKNNTTTFSNSKREVTMMHIDLIRTENFVAWDEFIQKCKDPNYAMFGNTAQKAKKFGLIDVKGNIPKEVQEIALAVIKMDSKEKNENVRNCFNGCSLQ